MKVHRGKRASVQIICGMTLAGIFSCQSLAYAEAETERERYGYYAQKIEASMDLENTISVQEGDGAADLLETGISQNMSLVGTSYEINQQLQTEMENGYTWEEPLVVQNPYAMGYLGVEKAWEVLQGAHFDAGTMVDTATTVVTKENMFTMESQKALFSFG